MTDVKRVSVIRSLAEKVLGPLILARRMPEKLGGGKLVVSGRVGGLKFILKRAENWDPELLKIASILVKKNDVVWDIGANVGLFSKSAAYLSGPKGHVYAVEADADAQVLLRKTISHCDQREAGITLLPVAISDQLGWETFSISRRARASNSLSGYGSSSTGGILQNITVPAVSLDNMLTKFPPPDVLKIDVEGAELKVLKGGEKLMRTVRPRIYCEISSENSEELENIFNRHSYRFLDGSTISSSADLYRRGNQIGFNTVAMPEELVPG